MLNWYHAYPVSPTNGDSADYAVDKWCNILRNRAHELLHEPKKMLEPPTDEND